MAITWRMPGKIATYCSTICNLFVKWFMFQINYITILEFISCCSDVVSVRGRLWSFLDFTCTNSEFSFSTVSFNSEFPAVNRSNEDSMTLNRDSSKVIRLFNESLGVSRTVVVRLDDDNRAEVVSEERCATVFSFLFVVEEVDGVDNEALVAFLFLLLMLLLATWFRLLRSSRSEFISVVNKKFKFQYKPNVHGFVYADGLAQKILTRPPDYHMIVYGEIIDRCNL